MAFYILINKIEESETEATYSFYDSAYPNDVGELSIDKSNGETSHTKGSNEQYYMRAATKVRKSFKSGELPNQLEWAS
ncbi:hypothetical protein QT397_24755 [Microbulbifer sp. MKSA007]|nr:hypothetical protein QT397_24755 [Microbulbifer sp. MKSA007]